MADDLEEQYLLRVQDRALAARLNRVLQEDAAERPADADINLEFEGAAVLGQLGDARAISPPPPRCVRSIDPC